MKLCLLLPKHINIKIWVIIAILPVRYMCRTCSDALWDVCNYGAEEYTRTWSWEEANKTDSVPIT